MDVETNMSRPGPVTYEGDQIHPSTGRTIECTVLFEDIAVVDRFTEQTRQAKSSERLWPRNLWFIRGFHNLGTGETVLVSTRLNTS